MTGHAEWEELAAGYALDSLEPEDEHEFLRHLRGCDLCARTLGEMRSVAGHLAYAADAADPPPALRASILDAVGASERAPSARPGTAPRAVPRARAPLRERVRRLPAPWLATAAALVGLLVLGLWNATLRMEADRTDAALELRRTYERMALDPDARARLVAGDGAVATALVRGDRAMLLVSGLPASHPGSVMYVVWAEDRAGRLHAMEPFEIATPGEPNLLPPMRLPVPLTDVVGLAVSREQGPVVPTAPTVAVLRGAIVRD